MTQNIEQLIDRYFDGQLSATEQTELFRAVDTDEIARQLFDAEQFIRGTFTTDLASVPQAAMEPSATLMAKLAATKPAATAVTQQAAQHAAQETVSQTASQVGSQAVSQIANVAIKSTSNMVGKVATTGLATAGKTIMGLSVGAFKMVAGAIATVAIGTGVYVTASNNTPDAQQVLTPIQDTATVLRIDNRVDTPAVPMVSSTPAPVIVGSAKVDAATSKSVPAAQSSAVSQPVMPDPMKDLPPARVNSSDTASTKIGTKSR